MSDENKIESVGQASGLLKRATRLVENNKIAYTRTANGPKVVAKDTIKDGGIIEIAPVIIVENNAFSVDELSDHIFTLDEEENIHAVGLGYLSLYKDSDKPNAEWYYDQDNNEIRITALRDIESGETITISYGDSYRENRK